MALRECDVEFAAMLFQRRKDMRRILGDIYEQRSREYQAYLPAIHEKHRGKSMLHSVMKAAQEMDALGHDPNMLVCAWLDHMEAQSDGKGN